MSEGPLNAIFLIESGPMKALVHQHIADRLAVAKRIRAMADELGGDEVVLGVTTDSMTGAPRAFRFKGTPPQGFKKADSRGFSYPLRVSGWAERFHEEKGHAVAEQVIAKALGIPLQIETRDKGMEWTGSRHLGNLLNACGWLYLTQKGPYAFWCPDIEAERKAERARGRIVTGPCARFKMEFEGCKRLLDEEWELMVAQYKLRQARRGKS